MAALELALVLTFVDADTKGDNLIYIFVWDRRLAAEDVLDVVLETAAEHVDLSAAADVDVYAELAEARRVCCDGLSLAEVFEVAERLLREIDVDEMGPEVLE